MNVGFCGEFGLVQNFVGFIGRTIFVQSPPVLLAYPEDEVADETAMAILSVWGWKDMQRTRACIVVTNESVKTQDSQEGKMVPKNLHNKLNLFLQSL